MFALDTLLTSSKCFLSNVLDEILKIMIVRRRLTKSITVFSIWIQKKMQLSQKYFLKNKHRIKNLKQIHSF